jgi:predicted  nucleic acid-binding Zn-ribbon protein
MNWLQSLFGNFFVQILVGLGLMVFLITIGEAIKSLVSNRTSGKAIRKAREASSKELVGLRNEIQSMKEMLLAHSMSLDENVSHLARRVEHLERQIGNVHTGGG